MAYNGVAEDYLNKEYGEAYNYVNKSNVGYYSDMFAKRDLSDPIYVYNELFSDYYKDIISFSDKTDENKNIFVNYKLPLTKYSNSSVSSGVFYSDKNLNANLMKYLNFDGKVNYDSSIDDAKLSEISNKYFNEVRTFVDIYYKFRQAYIYTYVNDKIGNDNKKLLDIYKPRLDKMEANLKRCLDECIKLSVELNKRENLDFDVTNNPVSELIGGPQMITLLKHYSSKTSEEIDYFENLKNFETKGATLINDSVYKNVKERNNEKSKVIESQLVNTNGKVVDQNLYQEDLNYKKLVNEELTERATQKNNKSQTDTMEVKSVTKPKNPNKVKMGIKKKVGIIILGVAALGGLAYGVNNYQVARTNEARIEQYIQDHTPQNEISQEQIEQNVNVSIYDQNVFINQFNVNDNARLYTDGRLQTGGSYMFQSPANISKTQYPRTIGVAKYDNLGNILDIQFVSDYDSLKQKYSEGYDLYSVLDANGIAWWNVNDTNLSQFNERTQSYTR